VKRDPLLLLDRIDRALAVRDKRDAYKLAREILADYPESSPERDEAMRRVVARLGLRL